MDELALTEEIINAGKLTVKQADAGTLIRFGIRKLLAEKEISASLTEEHIRQTPYRFYKALEDLFSGCYKDPKEVLTTSFQEENYDQLIIVRDIDFVSICAHHLLPFIGKVHFGYLPNKKVVGISKIPRLVEVLSARPQIQERLSHQIVQTFQEVVEPRGCAVVVSASHLCMSIRGVKKANAITDTIALQGDFLTNASLKHEFLEQLRSRR